MREYEPYAFKELVWLGEHAPGWTHAITIADPDWPFHEYAEGITPSRPGLIDLFSGGPASPVGSLGLWLDDWLVLAGRISGRFIDEQYLDATRRLYRIPI